MHFFFFFALARRQSPPTPPMLPSARPALRAGAALLLRQAGGLAASAVSLNSCGLARIGAAAATAAAPTTTAHRRPFASPSFAASAAAAAAEPAPAPAPPPPPPPAPAKGPRFTMAASANAAGARLKAAPTASGVLVDPYRGEPPPLPLTAWVTPSGWRARWRRWVGGAKSMYTLAKLRKLVPGFDLAAFKGEAGGLYAAACGALAAGDRAALRACLTPTEYTAAKRQLKARAEGGWAAVEWGLEGGSGGSSGGGGGSPLEVEVLRARLVMANPRDERAGFAQVTVGLDSRQTFVARDARGAVVASSAPDGVSLGGGAGGGGPAAPAMTVRDVWVFERFLGGGPAARWRVAARLPDPPPGAARPGWWRWLTGRG